MPVVTIDKKEINKTFVVTSYKKGRVYIIKDNKCWCLNINNECIEEVEDIYMGGLLIDASLSEIPTGYEYPFDDFCKDFESSYREGKIISIMHSILDKDPPVEWRSVYADQASDFLELNPELKSSIKAKKEFSNISLLDIPLSVRKNMSQELIEVMGLHKNN